MDGSSLHGLTGCPVHGGNTSTDQSVTKWWPNALNLDILHQHGARTNPMDEGYDHRAAVKALNFDAVKADVHALMTDNQEWWPADWGHYGGLMIRLAWQYPLCAVEVLAGQRQPRSGAPPALAGQEEVWQRAELGRLDRSVGHHRL